MATYAFRQPIVLEAQFASDSGAEDADAVNLRIKQPDGTLVTKVLGDLSHDDTGVYSYVFTPTMPGNHSYGFEWVGETAAEASFYVDRTALA